MLRIGRRQATGDIPYLQINMLMCFYLKLFISPNIFQLIILPRALFCDIYCTFNASVYARLSIYTDQVTMSTVFMSTDTWRAAQNAWTGPIIERICRLDILSNKI